MSVLRSLLSVAAMAFLLHASPSPAADGDPALVMEIGGLKNTYRIVFEQFDEENHFAGGALEILSDDDGRETPHTRIPFAAELKTDPKDKKSELLEIRCTAGYFFFSPVDKKNPYPPLSWKLTGRKGKAPVLKAKLWTYNAEKETWALEEMEFEKAAE